MPADIPARKTISTPLGEGTLNALDFAASSAYGPPIRVLPDANVIKIGGQSIFDRGKAAVWPLVKEIAAPVPRTTRSLSAWAAEPALATPTASGWNSVCPPESLPQSAAPPAFRTAI